MKLTLTVGAWIDDLDFKRPSTSLTRPIWHQRPPFSQSKGYARSNPDHPLQIQRFHLSPSETPPRAILTVSSWIDVSHPPFPILVISAVTHLLPARWRHEQTTAPPLSRHPFTATHGATHSWAQYGPDQRIFARQWALPCRTHGGARIHGQVQQRRAIQDGSE